MLVGQVQSAQASVSVSIQGGSLSTICNSRQPKPESNMDECFAFSNRKNRDLELSTELVDGVDNSTPGLFGQLHGVVAHDLDAAL